MFATAGCFASCCHLIHSTDTHTHTQISNVCSQCANQAIISMHVLVKTNHPVSHNFSWPQSWLHFNVFRCNDHPFLPQHLTKCLAMICTCLLYRGACQRVKGPNGSFFGACGANATGKPPEAWQFVVNRFFRRLPKKNHTRLKGKEVEENRKENET